MNNDALVIGFFYIIGFLISVWILYAIIRSANDTTTRDRIQRQNQLILALIAEKLGCDVEEVKKVMDGKGFAKK